MQSSSDTDADAVDGAQHLMARSALIMSADVVAVCRWRSQRAMVVIGDGCSVTDIRSHTRPNWTRVDRDAPDGCRAARERARALRLIDSTTQLCPWFDLCRLFTDFDWLICVLDLSFFLLVLLCFSLLLLLLVWLFLDFCLFVWLLWWCLLRGGMCVLVVASAEK